MREQSYAVTKEVVCDPHRNALLQEGNQNDRVDARKLAELLHNNQLRAVYHGDHGLRTLKELVRSYLTITKISAGSVLHRPVELAALTGHCTAGAGRIDSSN
jgi:hypothetical protein